MRRWLPLPLALCAAAVLLLPACAPPPEPRATLASSPPLSAEEEAFRAAEETYRAYIDALNRVDLADPATFEPVYALTTGELKQDVQRNFEDMRSQGISLYGESVVLSAEPTPRENYDSITIHACVDVSGTGALDSQGQKISSMDRPDVQSFLVTVKSQGDPANYYVGDFSGGEGDKCQNIGW